MNMILVEVDTGHLGLVRLVAGLPDGTPISIYEGFVEIRDNELPNTASLLVGHVERFHELFNYPAVRPLAMRRFSPRWKLQTQYFA